MNEILSRIKILRKTTPDCLEELFEAQNRICDLCNKPIQDLILAELDHSTPLIKYAKDLSLSIEDAVLQCNSLNNLRATHASCNGVKHDMERSVWFELGKDKRKPRNYSADDIQKRKYIDGAGGRNRYKLHGDAFTNEARSRGGKVSGRNNVLSGHWSRVTTFESRQKGGLKNVENGNLERIRTLEGSIKGGKTQGRIAADSGQLLSITTYETRAKGGQIQGVIQGKKNVESGQLASLRTPEHQRIAGRLAGLKAVSSGSLARARHIHWHVRRNIINPECKLCQGIQECQSTIASEPQTT